MHGKLSFDCLKRLRHVDAVKSDLHEEIDEEHEDERQDHGEDIAYRGDIDAE